MTVRRRSEAARLAVGGLAATPMTWELAALAAIPGRIADLGTVATGFTGEAVPLGPILAAADPAPAATHATVVSDDGHYRASIPLAELRDKGWLAFGLEGGPLPRDRGGPLRVVVPQGRTLCWNVKGAVEIELTDGPRPDSVPANPPH